jgi:hypothetical protein
VTANQKYLNKKNYPHKKNLANSNTAVAKHETEKERA